MSIIGQSSRSYTQVDSATIDEGDFSVHYWYPKGHRLLLGSILFESKKFGPPRRAQIDTSLKCLVILTESMPGIRSPGH